MPWYFILIFKQNVVLANLFADKISSDEISSNEMSSDKTSQSELFELPFNVLLHYMTVTIYDTLAQLICWSIK